MQVKNVCQINFFFINSNHINIIYTPYAQLIGLKVEKLI